MKIRFNYPYSTGKEIQYISEAISEGRLAGDGTFTHKCERWLQENLGCKRALLTHSCTAALEMSAILADVQPGDEIIMPSYTFVSTANAFVLRGGIPVFADIRPDTMNIDETKIEAAITDKTKAIVVVHYAGIACEMDKIIKIAKEHNLLVIEDAAQGMLSNYKGRPLGSIGHMAAFSFHETKNIISGEGGALIINESSLVDRAEIVREKGTNRAQFFRGEVDKYTWVDIGSSFLPGELIASFLYAQLEESEEITKKRMIAWNHYHNILEALENIKGVKRQYVPEHCKHNAHMYYLILPNLKTRTAFIEKLKEKDVHPVFHYVPLHSSPGGKRYGRVSGELSHTESLCERLVRLPLWPNLPESCAETVRETALSVLT